MWDTPRQHWSPQWPQHRKLPNMAPHLQVTSMWDACRQPHVLPLAGSHLQAEVVEDAVDDVGRAQVGWVVHVVGTLWVALQQWRVNSCVIEDQVGDGQHPPLLPHLLHQLQHVGDHQVDQSGTQVTTGEGCVGIFAFNRHPRGQIVTTSIVGSKTGLKTDEGYHYGRKRDVLEDRLWLPLWWDKRCAWRQIVTPCMVG